MGEQAAAELEGAVEQGAEERAKAAEARERAAQGPSPATPWERLTNGRNSRKATRLSCLLLVKWFASFSSQFKNSRTAGIQPDILEVLVLPEAGNDPSVDPGLDDSRGDGERQRAEGMLQRSDALWDEPSTDDVSVDVGKQMANTSRAE